ncbi:MAG: MATE family efflux transporter [Eubacterium sp.]|nr:MATE family efflux transporter [Eubacterium sp.]
MNDNTDFTRGSIPKKLIAFMLPILGALILQAMYSAVDLIIVGHFGTTEGISGVSIGASIVHLFTFVVVSLTTGVTVLMGQYIGQGVPERIGRLLGHSICFFLALGAFLSLIMFFCARPIALIMQAPEESLELTILYIRICGGGFLFVIFYNFISCVFRGMGDSRLPLLFVCIACVANMAGDLILVAGLHMNVAGAAIATISSQALSVILSFLVIRRKDLPFRIRREDLCFGSEIPKFFHIGSPLALQEILTNFTFLAICAFVNRMGLKASSGYGVSQRIVSFILLIPSSIMQSMASFVAQNVGAGNEKRARQSMLCGMLIGGMIGVPVAAFTFFRGDLLAMLFTGNTEVVRYAFQYLKGFAPEAIVTSILFSFYGYFNGHSRSRVVMALAIIQSMLIRLPVSWYMSSRPDATLTGIGLAAPSATIIGIILGVIWYKRSPDQIS